MNASSFPIRVSNHPEQESWEEIQESFPDLYTSPPYLILWDGIFIESENIEDGILANLRVFIYEEPEG